MASAYYMDAEITPAQSLSRHGSRIVIFITVLAACVPALTFAAMGAALVAPFVAVAVTGLWVAFWAINRPVMAERVRVSSDFVEVIRAGKTVWSSATAFTRVEPGETAVRLAMSGRRMAVARSLSPGERRDFAGALDQAIRRAKAERYVG